MSDLYPYRRDSLGRRQKPLKRKSPLKKRKKHKRPDLFIKKAVYYKIVRDCQTKVRPCKKRAKYDFIFNEEISNDRKKYDNDGIRYYECEECGCYLKSPLHRENFSHYIPKGAAPSLRYVKDNINILCFDCHQKWEFGDRETMKIFDPQKKIWLRHLERLIRDGIVYDVNKIRYPQELP